MTAVKDALVWIDCEMTGLDPDHDCLVEVAVIVTDANLNLLDDGIDLLIQPLPGALEHMNAFVRQMHTSSGLLEALATEAIPVEQAEARILDYIRQWVPDAKRALLAGNSIGTDKRFLEAQMPALMDHLHYRVVDVSSVKELAKRWYPRTYFHAPAKHGGHRALADIRESLQELLYYRAVLFPAGEGPSAEECQDAARKVGEAGLGA